MLKLEDIKKDVQVSGIQEDEIVRIVQVEPVGDAAITVYYKDSQGRLGEQIILELSFHPTHLAPWHQDFPSRTVSE